MKGDPGFARWQEIRDRAVEHIESVGNEDIVSAIASEKYGFISGALKETYSPEISSNEQKTTDIIDAIVTHKLFGFPIFLLIMWFIFWVTFELGNYPMDWIDAGVGWIGDTVRELMPAGPLKDMIVDGIIGGVGGVIVFLAEYHDTLLLYFVYGRFGLHGSCGIYHGQDNAQDGAWQVVHSVNHGVWLQCACRYVVAHHRKS